MNSMQRVLWRSNYGRPPQPVIPTRQFPMLSRLPDNSLLSLRGYVSRRALQDDLAQAVRLEVARRASIAARTRWARSRS